MKILVVKFGKSRGTTDRLFNDYCKILFQAGYNICTLSYDDDEVETQLPLQIPKFYIKNYGKWDPIAGWKIKNTVKSIDPTIIVTHGNRATQLMNDFCSFLPIASVCHSAKGKNFLDTENIIVIGESVKNDLISLCIDLEHIYQAVEPIYLPEYHVLGDRDLLDKKILTIGTITRLKARNSHRTLLNAISILQNRGIKINVVIASTGTEEAALRKMTEELMIDDVVSFSGWVEDKISFFKDIDILCVPSLQSSLAHSVLEGFASGLPVIASDIDCHKEVSKEDENIMFFQAGEADSLALSIEQLYNDRKLAMRIAENGLDYVTQKCKPDLISQNLYQILNSIAGEEAFV
jgi:glycosyltransferase involved in cell wall biosynthesis